MDVSGSSYIIHERWPLQKNTSIEIKHDIENQISNNSETEYVSINSEASSSPGTVSIDSYSPDMIADNVLKDIEVGKIEENNNENIINKIKPINNDEDTKDKIKSISDNDGSDMITRSVNTGYNTLDTRPIHRYNLNEKIEGNYRNKGRWYPGKITKVGINNLYNIQYDDGERETSVSISCIRKQNYDNDTVSSITLEDKITVSKVFTPVEFKKIQAQFNTVCKNGKTISRVVLERLIDEYEEINIYHLNDYFLNEYLSHLGNNYTFLDYYSIINHLRNLKQIKCEKLIELSELNTEDKINKRKLDMNLNNFYDEVERERQKINIDKLKYDLSKEKELLVLKQKYENEVALYSKDLYGITCYGVLKKTCKNWFGQNVIKDFDKIYEIIGELPTLNNYEKNLILIRFQSILIYCIKHYNTISKWYNSTQIFLIACSIANPALLSINSERDNTHYYSIFWSVWISQLLVSLITSYISFFKWDKKYFLFNAYKTKINQEIWLYIELSGNHYKDGPENNHSKQLSKFLNRMENLYKRLKMSEFEIETTNNDEETSNNKEKTNKQAVEDIMQSRQMIVDEDERNRRNHRREEY